MLCICNILFLNYKITNFLIYRLQKRKFYGKNYKTNKNKMFN